MENSSSLRWFIVSGTTCGCVERSFSARERRSLSLRQQHQCRRGCRAGKRCLEELLILTCLILTCLQSTRADSSPHLVHDVTQHQRIAGCEEAV